MTARGFRIDDIVEESGEGRGRFFRIAAKQRLVGLLVEIDGSERSIGWKPLAKMTLASESLKERITELQKELRDARRRLREIEPSRVRRAR